MDIIINRKPVSIPVLPILTAVAVAILLFMSIRVGRVQGSQIGVLVNNLSGEVTIQMTPGAIVYNGLLTDFDILDNSVQTIRMVAEHGDEVRIKTDDGSDVTMDVEVNYRLIQDANLIRDRVIPESGVTQAVSTTSSGRGGRRSMTTELVDAYKAKWVRDYARSVVRYVFGELDTKTFYNAAERDGKTRASVSELNRLLNPHGIEVQQVVPDNFEFYSEFEKLIADTKAADEEVDSQKRKADAALEDQKKQETTATARANVEIATITGDLAKAILISEADAAKETKAAEAYAYTQKQGADAGLYDAKNMAQSLLVKATAEAEGVRQLAASLSGEGGKNLVKMEYAKVLEKAVINGLPYSTDPRIQKLEISGENNTPLKAVGGKR